MMNSQQLDNDRSGKPLNLPEPDPENITVLTRNLPNKPILPWHHYDSPWSEAHEENVEDSEIPDPGIGDNQSDPISTEDIDNQSDPISTEHTNPDNGMPLQSNTENLEELDKDEQNDVVETVPAHEIVSTLKLSDELSQEELPNLAQALHTQQPEASEAIKLPSKSGQGEFVVGSEPLATNHLEVSEALELDPEFCDAEDVEEDEASSAEEGERLLTGEWSAKSLTEELLVPPDQKLKIVDEHLKIVDDEIKQLG